MSTRRPYQHWKTLWLKELDCYTTTSRGGSRSSGIRLGISGKTGSFQIRWMIPIVGWRCAILSSIPCGPDLVQNAWDWPWSSARAHVTGVDETGMLNMELWGKYFDKIRWKEFLLEGLDKTDEIDLIRVANRTGRPLGSEDFIRKPGKDDRADAFSEKKGAKTQIGKKTIPVISRLW